MRSLNHLSFGGTSRRLRAVLVIVLTLGTWIGQSEAARAQGVSYDGYIATMEIVAERLGPDPMTPDDLFGYDEFLQVYRTRSPIRLTPKEWCPMGG